MSKTAMKVLIQESSPKGNIFEASKVAGVLAAKQTPMLIPYCHPLELSKVHITYDINESKGTVVVTAEVAYSGKTGVEMEALCAVSVAALTIYDMLKFKDKSMKITDIKLLEKSGGKSGDFKRA